MKNSIFGLDIGSTTVRVAWFDAEKNNIKYLAASSTPVVSKGMTSESPFDHQEIAELINKLVINAKISTNNVSVALPENHVYTKVIEMPNLSEKEIAGAIYWEAEQYIPASLDTMNLDWAILRKPKSNDPSAKMQVLLVAAQKQYVKRYQMILELAGLSVVSIESEVLSVIRSLVVNNSHFPTSMIMNIGALSTSLSIIQNGIIIFTYLVPLGGIAVSRAIAADFGFDIKQAEEYKRTYGLGDDNFGGKIRSAVEPVLASMVTEIKKAVSFYSEKYKNDFPISQLILSGGGSLLPGISTYFAKNIGFETVIGNPWKMLNIGGVPPDIMSRGPEFAVAIGLALKGYEQL